MKLRLTPALFIATALLSVTTASADTPTTQRSAPAVLFPKPDGRLDSKLDARLDAAFKALTRKDLFSGTVLIAKDGKVLFQGAYGLASREYDVPNNLDTQFNLGSTNKMFAAVSIAQLVEQGKLRFDDPIGKHLGTDWVNDEIREKVTVAHLLTHTAGIDEIFMAPEIMNGSKHLFKEIQDFQPIVAKLKLTREPGTQWSYSNTGFLLLGVIVEKVSGQSYWDYIRKNIFDKAGMTRTAAIDLEKINKNYKAMASSQRIRARLHRAHSSQSFGRSQSKWPTARSSWRRKALTGSTTSSAISSKERRKAAWSQRLRI